MNTDDTPIEPGNDGVQVGDHVTLYVGSGVRGSGTVVGLPSRGLRVTVRMDSNPFVVFDVGASAVERTPAPRAPSAKPQRTRRARVRGLNASDSSVRAGKTGRKRDRRSA